MKPKPLPCSNQVTVPSAPSAAAGSPAPPPSGRTLRRLRPLLARLDQEREPLALGEHPARHDRRAVHEDVGATAVGGREAVALAGLVPGHGAEDAERGVGRDVADHADLQRLRPARPLADLELHLLALAQHARPAVGEHLGGVDEDVLALDPAVGREEAEALGDVEPADGPVRHSRCSFGRARGGGPPVSATRRACRRTPPGRTSCAAAPRPAGRGGTAAGRRRRRRPRRSCTPAAGRR